MKVTKVVIHKILEGSSSQAICSAVLDDCLKLSDILLCKNDEGYFLILPSKQDVYKEVNALNDGVSIKYPVNRREKYNSDIKRFEEFYHPVSRDFYISLRDSIIDAYLKCKKNKEVKVVYYS